MAGCRSDLNPQGAAASRRKMMFDDIDFVMRNEREITISVMGIVQTIPLPLTSDVVAKLQETGWWPYLEGRLGPYVEGA